MSKPSERERYMRGEIDFHAYYGKLIDHLGESALRRMLPGERTSEQWRELIAEDEHLNNVALRQWDARHRMVVTLVRGSDELRAINGTGGWSLSDSVCVLKETARRYAA